MSNRLSPRDLLKYSVECFTDPARRSDYFNLYDENIVLRGYDGVDPGLASVKAYYEGFWSAFPDAQVKVEDLIEQGDKIALRFVIMGTHRGMILNIPPTGKAISFPGMTILQFKAGKCVERWSVTDSLSLLAQLGVLAQPN